MILILIVSIKMFSKNKYVQFLLFYPLYIEVLSCETFVKNSSQCRQKYGSQGLPYSDLYKLQKEYNICSYLFALIQVQHFSLKGKGLFPIAKKSIAVKNHPLPPKQTSETKVLFLIESHSTSQTLSHLDLIST